MIGFLIDLINHHLLSVMHLFITTLIFLNITKITKQVSVAMIAMLKLSCMLKTFIKKSSLKIMHTSPRRPQRDAPANDSVYKSQNESKASLLFQHEITTNMANTPQGKAAQCPHLAK